MNAKQWYQRFRSISKPWCSLIDSPHFTKLHLHLSTQTNSNHSLILMNHPLLSVDLHFLERAVEINHPFKTRGGTTEVLGSCHGLLCLYKSDAEILLSNISTGNHLYLPCTAIISPNEATAFSMLVRRVAYGFGYDSVHQDYKLLRIVQFPFTYDSEAMVYGLKSNSWKRVQGFRYDLPTRRSIGVFAGAALHWMVTPKGEMYRCVIVAFDLALEEYREVPEPPDAPDGEFFMQLGVLEGLLCVVCNYVRERSDLWVMKDYGVKESWTKLLSIAQPRVIRCFDYIKPLAYLRNGNEVLLVQDNKKLLSYDLKRNQVKNVRVRRMPASFDALVYVESLVKPVPMASGDDGTLGKQGKGSNKTNVAKKRDDFLSTGFKLVL